MNYGNIKKTDVADGPGVRVSLFVSGCTHHCKGCFNSETWDFQYGKLYTPEVEEEILEALKPDFIQGLTVLGGEPMEEQNRETVLGLLEQVKKRYPQKDIWCYTGYRYEEDLLRWIKEGKTEVDRMLQLIDVLVDGEFVEERKNLQLIFRGSDNQRLIDVPATRKKGEVITLPLK